MVVVSLVFWRCFVILNKVRVNKRKKNKDEDQIIQLPSSSRSSLDWKPSS